MLRRSTIGSVFGRPRRQAIYVVCNQSLGIICRLRTSRSARLSVDTLHHRNCSVLGQNCLYLEPELQLFEQTDRPILHLVNDHHPQQGMTVMTLFDHTNIIEAEELALDNLLEAFETSRKRHLVDSG